MDKKKSIVKKIVAVGLGGVVLLGLGGFAGSQMFPKEIVQTQYITKEVPVTVEVEKIVEVEKLVPVTELVDNENLGLVLDHIFENDGNINYITDGLDEDEVGSIVDRIILVDDFKKLSVQAIQKDLFDELDGEIIEGITLDDRDMKSLRVDDEADEILISDIDFPDKDAVLITSGSFKQDGTKFLFEAEVIFRDGEYDELGSIIITKE